MKWKFPTYATLYSADPWTHEGEEQGFIELNDRTIWIAGLSLHPWASVFIFQHSSSGGRCRDGSKLHEAYGGETRFASPWRSGDVFPRVRSRDAPDLRPGRVRPLCRHSRRARLRRSTLANAWKLVLGEGENHCGKNQSCFPKIVIHIFISTQFISTLRLKSMIF